MKKSPFKFLDSYSKEDRNIFFGRDKEIEELHSRVFQSRVLVVYGISGTGKSSLINCGLANKFNDSDWLPVSIRRGSNINESLVDGLTKNTTEGVGKGKTEVLKVIRSVYLDHFKPIFLIFDQFEEVFIFGTKQERDEFISTVKKVLDSDLQCRFIFSVREEYLAGFTEFERIITTFLENRIRIEKMTRQNAARAIEGPCEVNGIAVEEGLPEIILDKLNPESPDVELTYLQVFLDKLFRIAAEEDADVEKITCLHAENTGDVKDLLGAFLEEQISHLDDPETGLVILKSFVSVKGTKHQVTESEVAGYSQTLGRDAGSSVVKDMIQKFISLRILRDKDEQGRYELRHDSLASVIYEKITLVEKELLEIRQFIENSWSNFERRNLFLSSADLEYIAPYEDKLFLSDRLTKFISQSKKIIHKAKRRRQNVMIIAAGTLIAVLSFFSVWALRERKNAIDQQRIAEEQKNSALSAMAIADSARKDALVSKDLALRNEKIAIGARAQSESARKEAVAQRESALTQKNIADRLSVQAAEQAKIANSEKLRAELERKKAIDAEAEAKRLGMLSTAQNMALTSMSMEKDPHRMGSLAIKAYADNLENGGQNSDPVIFQALTNAWMVLDSSRHSVFKGIENETRSIANNHGLVTADLEGKVRRLDENGTVMNESFIRYISPVSFIKLSPSGRFIATQHDNLDLNFWQHSDNAITPYNDPVRKNCFIKAISFSDDEKRVTYAFDDSTIYAQHLDPPQEFVTFVTKSIPETVIFCNADTICYATSGGSVFIGSLSERKFDEIYSSADSRPLSLCWNKKTRSLFTGWSDGRMVIIPVNGNGSPPVNYSVHGAGIEHIAFNQDYSLLATASRDRTIRVYFYDEFFTNGNFAGGSVLITDISGRSRSIAFTPDNRLVTSLSDKLIRVWESSPEKLVSGIRNILEKNSSLTESTLPK